MLFNADSAYAHIEAQCAFGPRVPNTEAHERCGQYIVSRFKALGLAVTEQKMELKAYNGATLKCMNIFASTDTTAKRRILVSAHWDSRPWADNDPDENNHKTPVLAANDGASGVAVMLELARALMEDKPSVGVDFVCFDAEDYGVAQWDESNYPGDMSNSWCLGSQYFAANLPFADYRPAYAVNLDMVGGKGALFYQEGFSARLAPGVVAKVWAAAEEAGYGSMFPKQPGGYRAQLRLRDLRFGENDRLALAVRGRDLLDRKGIAHRIVDVALAHAAHHAVDPQCDLIHGMSSLKSRLVRYI